MYRAEQIEYISNEYTTEPSRATVDRLAAELGVSNRSIIGKLVSLKLYEKAPKTNKLGLPVELKRDLCKQIEDIWGVEVPSLAKAERNDLRVLRDAMIDPLNVRAHLVDLEDGAE